MLPTSRVSAAIIWLTWLSNINNPENSIIRYQGTR
jgi:hypothetical protein